MAETGVEQWVGLKVAAERLGTNYRRVRILIDNGHLSVRRLPGGNPQVNLAEVEALAESATKPGQMAEAVG